MKTSPKSNVANYVVSPKINVDVDKYTFGYIIILS